MRDFIVARQLSTTKHRRSMTTAVATTLRIRNKGATANCPVLNVWETGGVDD
jgi:hypothetical protein